MAENEIDLNALLDSRIDSDEPVRKRELGHFWATDMGKCKRQVYYSFTNPKTFPPSKKRIFRIGVIIHDYIQRLLKGLEGTVFKEVWSEKYISVTDTETDLIITGKIDTFIIPQEGVVPVVFEFKSENERSFAKRDEPAFNHKCQLTIYLRSQRLPFGYIVYINKTTMELNQMKVMYSESLFSSMMQHTRDIYWHLKNSKLPQKTARAKWECDYCNYKDLCSRNQNDALHNRLFPNKPADSVPVVEKKEVTANG
jgi:CRISPR/Cas system-associated exonuclease Cas4 (RecB family)